VHAAPGRYLRLGVSGLTEARGQYPDSAGPCHVPTDSESPGRRPGRGAHTVGLGLKTSIVTVTLLLMIMMMPAAANTRHSDSESLQPRPGATSSYTEGPGSAWLTRPASAAAQHAAATRPSVRRKLAASVCVY
jgi:hypothetical protein